MPSEARAEALLEAGGKRLHPLTLLFSTFAIARQMVFPAVVAGVTGSDSDWGLAFALIVAILGVVGALGAAATWLAFRYRLAGDELALRSGVLSRQHRVIPLARVQNVEVRQGLFHRVFDVAELRVETAGGGGEPEARFAVLGVHEAQALRAELLARRRAAAPVPSAEAAALASDAAGWVSPDAAPAAPPLVRLSTGDVILAGATANEAGVIAALAGGGLQFLDDLRIPWIDRAFAAAGGFVDGRGGAALVLAIAGLAVAVLFVGWLISIAGALLRYHGFTLHREGGELRKRFGLLTLHEASVPLGRVQALRMEESLLRRPFGLASLMIETAGGTPGKEPQGGAEAFVPLTRRTDVARLVRGIFGEMDLDAVRLSRVDPKSLRRGARTGFLVLLLATSPAWVMAGVTGRWTLLLWMAALPFVAYGLARWEYANRGYALVPGFTVTRSGILNRVTWIVPDRKLQTLHVRQSPFQRRHGLASLVVDTASGGAQSAVIDLSEPRARELLRALTGRVLAAARAGRKVA